MKIITLVIFLFAAGTCNAQVAKDSANYNLSPLKKARNLHGAGFLLKTLGPISGFAIFLSSDPFHKVDYTGPEPKSDVYKRHFGLGFACATFLTGMLLNDILAWKQISKAGHPATFQLQPASEGIGLALKF